MNIIHSIHDNNTEEVNLLYKKIPNVELVNACLFSIRKNDLDYFYLLLSEIKERNLFNNNTYLKKQIINLAIEYTKLELFDILEQEFYYNLHQEDIIYFIKKSSFKYDFFKEFLLKIQINDNIFFESLYYLNSTIHINKDPIFYNKINLLINYKSINSYDFFNYLKKNNYLPSIQYEDFIYFTDNYIKDSYIYSQLPVYKEYINDNIIIEYEKKYNITNIKNNLSNF
jgi:hypothetical protein